MKASTAGVQVAQGFVAAALIAIGIRAFRREVATLPEVRTGRADLLAVPRGFLESPECAVLDRGKAPSSPDPEAAYLPDSYSPARRLRENEDSYERWELDPRELSWLLAHSRHVLTREMETIAQAGGGLRVARLSEGSFASLRGLEIGDILLDLNGQELNDSFDVEDFLFDPAYSGAKGWRLCLLRRGKPWTIDYRSGDH